MLHVETVSLRSAPLLVRLQRTTAEHVKNHKLDTVLESSPLLIPSVIFGGNLADGVVLKNMGGRRSETKEKLNFFFVKPCRSMTICNGMKWFYR